MLLWWNWWVTIRKESKNLPLEFVENELIISKGRLEGEEDIIEKGEIDDGSK